MDQIRLKEGLGWIQLSGLSYLKWSIWFNFNLFWFWLNVAHLGIFGWWESTGQIRPQLGIEFVQLYICDDFKALG